jgi:predicted MarR family transcription regulator
MPDISSEVLLRVSELLMDGASAVGGQHSERCIEADHCNCNESVTEMTDLAAVLRMVTGVSEEVKSSA